MYECVIVKRLNACIDHNIEYIEPKYGCHRVGVAMPFWILCCLPKQMHNDHSPQCVSLIQEVLHIEQHDSCDVNNKSKYLAQIKNIVMNVIHWLLWFGLFFISLGYTEIQFMI